MDRIVKKFIKKLGRMSLATDERRALRSEILEYTQKHPMPVSEKRFWPGLLSRRFAPAMLVVLIAVTLGGGISYAAEQTVPGDILYPIKIYVNEEIRAAIAPSTEAKASWEVQRLERRLEEAEQLIAREKFNDSTNSELKKNLARHSLAINQKLAILTLANELTAATAVSSDFDATIYAHTKLLPRLTKKPDIESDVSELVAGFAPDEIDGVVAAPQPGAPAAFEALTKVEIEKDGNVDGTSRIQAQKRKEASEKRIKEINKVFARTRNLDAGSQTRLQSRYASATQLFLEGEAKMEKEQYAEASSLFQEARRYAQEVKVLIKAREKLGKNVNLNNGTHRKAAPEENERAREEETKSESKEDDRRDNDEPTSELPVR